MLNKYGITVNFEPGKTEAIVVYRGKKALEEKQRLLKPNGSRSLQIPIQSHAGQNTHSTDSTLLRVVQGYKHLGSWVDETGSLVPDANRRSASAMSSYAPLAVKLFGSSAIGTASKIRLAFSLIVSKLIYNVHVVV